MDSGAKQVLCGYLQQGREAVLWKLDGLGSGTEAGRSPDRDAGWWIDYRARLQAAADGAR